MTIEATEPEKGKFRKTPPVENTNSSINLEDYINRLSQEREKLREVVKKNFNNIYYVLEACLSVKAQSLIDGITLPFCLILLGDPSSYKSTILYIVGSLPDCYKSDSFTPKSFVSHSASNSRTQLSSIDMLPRIKDKTLITPELAPIFSVREDNLIETIGILTRILDGKGFKTDSGVHGWRGYEGDYYFSWLGAIVEIPRYVWRIFGNLGPKMYFLRVPSDPSSEEEKRQKIIANLKSKSYNKRVEETKTQLKSFWDVLITILNQTNVKIVWNESKDDHGVIEKIVVLAQLLSKLRGSVPPQDTEGWGGSNYNFGSSIIENPERASNSLYNLARGHAVICGRNFITDDDLGVVILVTLSSASKERVELFKLLIENNGKMNTNQFMEKAKVSIATALKNMQELAISGLVEKIEEQTTTKPITVIKLKDSYNWFLGEEFRSYLDNLYS